MIKELQKSQCGALCVSDVLGDREKLIKDLSVL